MAHLSRGQSQLWYNSLGRGSSMDEAKRKQWAKCIIQGAMQIENSVTNEDIEWNINVLQMAINKMKAELVEP